MWNVQGALVRCDQLAEKLAEQAGVNKQVDAAGITDGSDRTRRIGNQVDFSMAPHTAPQKRKARSVFRRLTAPFDPTLFFPLPVCSLCPLW